MFICHCCCKPRKTIVKWKYQGLKWCLNSFHHGQHGEELARVSFHKSTSNVAIPREESSSVIERGKLKFSVDQAKDELDCKPQNANIP